MNILVNNRRIFKQSDTTILLYNKVPVHKYRLNREMPTMTWI
jgi:hypothetical protein